MSCDLDHLRDHSDLYLALLGARVRYAASGDEGSEDLRAIAQRCQETIAVRRLSEMLVSEVAFEVLELSESEQQVIWMLATLATSLEARALLSRVTGELADPTLHAIRTVIYGRAPSSLGLRELSATGALRRLALIERTDGQGDVHESRQTWALAPRMLELLHGHCELDRSIAAIVDPPAAVPLGELALATGVADEVARAVAADGLVIAAGSPGLGRRTVLAAAARERGLEVIAIDARLLANDAAIARQLRAIARECQLMRRVPLLANLDALDEAQLAIVGRELVAQLAGLVLATCGASRPRVRWGRPVIVVELSAPGSAQLEALWNAKLGAACGGVDLGATYPLAPALIHHAAIAARARTIAVDGQLDREQVAAGIRTVNDDRLGQFARRLNVTQTWNDIVLPSEQLEAVSELISRVRGRRKVIEDWGFGAKVGKGLGVTALFSGPPGTGKTMLASLIARDLGLELYQVDLGKVVSKWIGETEKNLGALFDAAEAGCAVLLFDEADALFGKRTDVKSSNDRNANLETNYLLQRLESYTGVCLLTTNHDSHLDPAFQRRLSLHLRIELPDVVERAELWRAMLPAAVPLADDIDFERLAQRYSMSGGYIRNAVLRAAFVAADRGWPITGDALERAARREYEGMGKIVSA